jgi:hypothetical protein
VYNLPGMLDDLNLVAKPKLVNAKGVAWTLNPLSLKKSIAPSGTGEAVVGLSLPFQGIVPGKYRLVI